MSTNSNAEAASNPNEHLSIPKWINEEYFEDILAKDVPNYQRIVSFKPIAATAPGDNYTSIMVRVFLDVELKGEQKLQHTNTQSNKISSHAVSS